MFNSVFPFYLSIGMDYDQFWNEDVCLVKYYRRADEIQNSRRNVEMWRQGAYFNSALNAAVGNLFAKKGSTPILYVEQPFPITPKEAAQRQAREEQQRTENARAAFCSIAAEINKNFEED